MIDTETWIGWCALSDGEAQCVYYIQINREVGLLHVV